MRYLAFLLAAALVSGPARAHAQQPTLNGDPGATTVVVNRAPPPLGFAWGIEGTPGEPYPYPEIKTVVPGSNAARAGLTVGDTLVSVNGHDMRQLAPLFPDRTPGTKYTMRVRRGGEDLELTFIYPTPAAAVTPPGTRPRER
jgi:S1-C subfamily serine protease